jgi:chorismate dehydratase
VWAVREGIELGHVEEAFHKAKEYGVTHAGKIAQREAAALKLDPGFCRRYLTNIIHYDLGERELAGLNRYRELAAELELIPQGTRDVRDHRPHLVESR